LRIDLSSDGIFNFLFKRRIFFGRFAFGIGCGIGDDCALISIDHGKQLATTVDTLIEGVHFPANTSAQDIGRNISAKFGFNTFKEEY
jgi:thiamine monophosphate kinase